MLSALDLPDRAAALLSLVAATQERSLSQLTALAASQVPGCAASESHCLARRGELAMTQASSLSGDHRAW